ncbi:MAG: VWA domain-containing protein [Elusimicrobiota bacterium]|nr:VWA domain-containing protein [Endomicrobiia bacterium]MDW8165634.1 VWA domain-containing protein [Elusimicrobiota bacterium]
MSFNKIYWLYLGVVLIPLLAVFFISIYKKYFKLLSNLISLNLISKVITEGVFKIQKINLLLIFIILILFFVSLSEPQWGIQPQEIKTYGVDIIFIFDVSKSMLTEDITPNRLEFAKRVAKLLLEKLDTHRVGIITFAGVAFYHCPLTNDLQAVKEFLEIIDTDIVPYPGTKIAFALKEAIRGFKEIEKSIKTVILFTDGEDHDSYSKDIAKELKENNIIVYTIGIGTPEGKPIPIRDNFGRIIDYKKDKYGNIVTSKLNEPLLYEISEETSGRYFSSNYGEFSIATEIASEISNLKKSELKSKVLKIYKNRYHYFVYLIILLILLEIFLPKKWLVKL